jgi:DNA-binding NtrC family response regulator
MSMKRLILTGWGWKDYACAAALALRHFKAGYVLGMSTRRLPEFLDGCTGWNEIVILGIGLAGDPELLAKALDKLVKRGVTVRLISTEPPPESIGKTVLSKIAVFVGGDGITDAVSQSLKIPYDDLAPLLDDDSRLPAVRRWHALLEAAMYFYRNYQDAAAYGKAIRHLADRDPESEWDEAERRMVEHYERNGSREIVGDGPVIKALRGRIDQVARCDRARVLITGESGTGKETVALQIHSKSPRRNEPFIAFNCASVTPNLLEDRFFGHEKGAYTGATERKPGIFEQADGGTLFLDEIGELPLEVQGVLLRVLEGGRFTRLGGREEVRVDVRLVAATNRDLAARVGERAFREDLFHRLNVVPLRAPALREHAEDIPKIANSYWMRQHHRRLRPEQIEELQTYDFPGNVRELFNLLERASVLGETDFVRLLAEHRQMTAPLAAAAGAYPDELEAMTRQHVRRVYEKHGSNLTRAAEALKISRNTARKYLEQ